MPDNQTLSERLRKALGNYSDTSAWLRLNGAEILRALYDNERYRATIVQLEKERADAVERVRQMETGLKRIVGLCDSEYYDNIEQLAAATLTPQQDKP